MRIIVFTTAYPFGEVAESFFSTELEILSNKFESVELMPLRRMTGGPRAIPTNVRVHPPISTGKFFFAKKCLTPQVWMRAAKILLEATCQKKSPLWFFLKTAIYWACAEHEYKERLSFLKKIPDPNDVIVYSYWAGPQSSAIPFARKLGARTVVRYHSIDLYAFRKENRGFIPMRRELREAADLNVMISDDGREYFKKSPHHFNGRLEVIRLGSDDFGFRERHSPWVGPLILVSVSSILPLKRVERIAELVRTLGHLRPTHWHHVGGNPQELTHLHRLVRDLENIFLHGQLNRSELGKFYRETSCTAFINLSVIEGISVAAMEAMSTGLPVIATNVGGMSELVVTGESGLLIDADAPNNIAELATKILAECQPGRALARSQPRKFWEQHYSAEQNAKKLIGVLTSTFAQVETYPGPRHSECIS